jgi:hypothetical protein
MLRPDASIAEVYPSFNEYKAKLQLLFSFKEEVELPDAIQQELQKLADLLELCYFKYHLLDLAQLYAVMVFEKAMRIRLYDEYKSIAKIKLSVLLDRAKQLNLLQAEQVSELRLLKDFRNKGVHEPSEGIDLTTVFENINVLAIATHQIFTSE